MAEWLSGDVITNGIRTHYYRTGGDKPPLVLAHGSGDSGLCWTRVARALEAEYDIVMPDSRGHGLSEALESGYNSDERAADLADLIRALGLGKPAVAGHSMGGATTTYLAAYHPDVVGRAILEDPPFRAQPTLPPTPEQAERAAKMRQSALERRAMSREALIALGRQQSPTWDEVEFGPWADSKRQVSPYHVGSGPSTARTTWQEALRRITCPVLLVTADPERGSIVTPEIAAEAASILPGLKVVRLSGAGHNIRREQFDGYVAAVRGFLAEA